MTNETKMLGARVETAFSVDGDLIANALSKLTRITDSPIYLRASSNALELKAGGCRFLASKVISEGFQTISAGEFVIPCKGVQMLAKAIDDARYTFTVEKYLPEYHTVEELVLTVDGGGKTLKLVVEPTYDYPRFNSGHVESGNVLTLAKSELKNLLDKTLYAVAKELDRPIFTAVNFKAENDSLILSATNGARLAMATTKSFSLQGDINCNISSDVLSFILPLLKSKDDVQITFAPPCNVRIALGDFDINAWCVEGNFPSFAKAIPKLSPVSAAVNRAELQGALKLCKVFADVHNAISLCFLDGELEVSAEKIDVVDDVATGGSALVHLQAEVTGVGRECALANFNVGYLLDMLKSAGTANVALELSGSGITMRSESSVAVLAAMKNTVKLPEQKPAIAPPMPATMPANVITIDVESKVVA